MVNYLVIKYNKKYEIKCSKINVWNIKCSNQEINIFILWITLPCSFPVFLCQWIYYIPFEPIAAGITKVKGLSSLS